MGASVEDFRRHFDSLSDAALLQVNPEELVDAARLCYATELSSRGLQPKVSTPTNTVAGEACCQDETTHDTQLVSVAEFEPGDDPGMARALLDAEGIPAYLSNELEIRTKNLAPGLTGLHLLVPANCLEQAQLVLSADISDEELEAQAAAAADPDVEP